MHPFITLVECPRDAMQGWKQLIPSVKKVEYLNKLLQVGFDTLDCGSFVSAKAIPQMADTAEVIGQLEMNGSTTKLLVIVANERGANEACRFEHISNLGFPFSISPTFQHRNANSTIEQSWHRVNDIQNLCLLHGKKLVVYISMGFGNPYDDPYNEELVMHWVAKMAGIGIDIVSLADTVGFATPRQLLGVTAPLISTHKEVQIGVHLHSSSINWQAKIDAALAAGCLRFDGALKGIGGCPMAHDELVGNMDTEKLIPYFQSKGLLQELNENALKESLQLAEEIFHQ